MFDTPISLQSCCVEFICDNLDDLCAEASPEAPQSKLAFKDPDTYFHGNLSEQLLETLCERGKLTDDTIALFDTSVASLKRVSIQNAQLSTKGLRTLKGHKISELELIGLKSVTINDAIGCLGEWTLNNLKVLNVCNSTFLNSLKFCVVVSLSKLRNLRSLNVSWTEFNKHGLEIIAEDLPNLETLDISSTPVNDINPLRKCKHRLRHLAMYNIPITNIEEVVPVLCDLTKLVHLDVSDDLVLSNSSQPSFIDIPNGKFSITDLLNRTDCLPNLTSLDISGKEGATEKVICSFLSTHRGIMFLGLSKTEYCDYPCFSTESHPSYYQDLVTSGEASEKQVLESLRRYVLRCKYMEKSLYSLFKLTQNMTSPREDIIQLVLPAMKSHPKQLTVQMAATACLYNLSKGHIGFEVHPRCLKDVINLTLLAMENFPNHQQLQKNALLTLCSDRILQEVSFDKFRCARLVMDCLCQFQEPSMNRMSVAICSILAAKISTAHTSALGSRTRYMQKMLDLVKQKVQNKVIDITLRFTLSALWNLTDESPPTCHVFLKEKGLEVFMMTLMVVEEMDVESRIQVETKILGLLNNIAEVKHLRENLMREEFMMLVQKLIHAKEIDVSYFAAGIVANLASDGKEAWNIVSIDREKVLEELGEVVMKWEQPKGVMVAYRSFKPFFNLLTCYSCPTVQLWAVWAVHHVCAKNSGKRYCEMLEEEGGGDILRSVLTHSSTTPQVMSIVNKILNLCSEKSNKTDTTGVIK